jgi:ABC-type nitrate/sulfonate/bicarbonate transport system substrate-binding protein
MRGRRSVRRDVELVSKQGGGMIRILAGATALLLCVAGTRAETLGFAGSVTWFGQVPIMVAIDKGFFKEQGVDIEYQVILNSSDRLASVDAGSSAFSNLGRSSVIPAMARGDTSFFYFANVDDSPGIEGCWARPGIASIKDLRGKKVAANTSAEITLSGLLDTQNMSEKDIDYLGRDGARACQGRCRGCLRLAAAARWAEEGRTGRQAARSGYGHDDISEVRHHGVA